MDFHRTSREALVAIAFALALPACNDATSNGPDLSITDTDDGGANDLGGRDFAAMQRDGSPGDGAGDLGSGPPTITFLTPQAGDFIGGVITVEVSVESSLGVDEKSVLAIFGGNMAFTVTLAHEKGTSKYSGLFDTTTLPPAFVLPVLSVRANDVGGHMAEAAEEVILDNVPPAISMDPPPVHVIQIATGICSHPFDPLGSETAGDGDVVGQLMTLRARIEDRGNRATGQTFTYLSEINPLRVHLYVAAQAWGPLVVDTNNDGFCDDLNPQLVANGQNANMKAVEVPLAPVPSAGAPDYTPGGFDTVCVVGSKDVMQPPKPITLSTSLTYILAYTELLKSSAIWTIPPLVMPPSRLALGTQFDAANNLPDGPLCAAVVAYDKAGNRNVSAPLRLCLDKNGTGKVCDTKVFQGPGTDPNVLPDCGVPRCKAAVKLNTTVNGSNSEVPFPVGGTIYGP